MPFSTVFLTDRSVTAAREVPQRQGLNGSASQATFCHSFDLAKRLASGDIKGRIAFHPSMSPPSSVATPRSGAMAGEHPTPSLFKAFIRDLGAKLASSPSDSIHRVVVPNLLSPTSYTGSACRPEEVLQFLHALRALLRRYVARLTALVTLPLALFPRSTGLTRWMELLSDSILELVPLRADSALLAHHAPPPSSKSSSAGAAADDQQKTQGLLKVHALPVFDEKGGGSHEAHAAREDQSFSVSRSRGLVIRPFSLPPVLGDDETERKEAGDKASKKSMEF